MKQYVADDGFIQEYDPDSDQADDGLETLVYLAADVERVFTPLLQKIVGNSFDDSWVNDDLMNEAKALLAQLKP